MFTVVIDVDAYGFEYDTERRNFDTEQEAKDFIHEQIKSVRDYCEDEGEGDFNIESYYNERCAAYMISTDTEETYIYRLIGS